MNRQDNTIEMLRTNAPGELVRHREYELDLAMPLLRQAVEASGVVLTHEFSAATHYEEKVVQQVKSVEQTAVHQAHQEGVTDMFLHRANEAVDAAFDGGEGNPLFDYDQKAA